MSLNDRGSWVVIEHLMKMRMILKQSTVLIFDGINGYRSITSFVPVLYYALCTSTDRG